MRYLDFENHEKGYTAFRPTRENFIANIGKTICWVTRRDIDNRRGYVFTRFGVINHVRRNTVYLNDYSVELPIRDILECAIKIEQP